MRVGALSPANYCARGSWKHLLCTGPESGRSRQARKADKWVDATRRDRRTEWTEWQARQAESAGEAKVEREIGSQSIFYKPCGVRWGDDLKLCVVTQIMRSYWPRTQRIRLLRPEVVPFIYPARHGRAAELPCTKHRDMNRLAPNSPTVLQRLDKSHVDPTCLFGHPPDSAVSAGQHACSVHMPCGPSVLGRAVRLRFVVTESRQR